METEPSGVRCMRVLTAGWMGMSSLYQLTSEAAADVLQGSVMDDPVGMLVLVGPLVIAGCSASKGCQSKRKSFVRFDNENSSKKCHLRLYLYLLISERK